MTLLFSKDELCKRDGICAAVCPRGLIDFTGPSTLPKPVPGADEQCSSCGHCVAVCPHGALFHTAMAPDQCPPVHREWMLDREKVEHFLRSRRSIRNYKDKPVDPDLLAKLIDMARFAPSGGNTQPVEWLVILKPDEVRGIAEMVADWMRHIIHQPGNEDRAEKFWAALKAWDAGEERICRRAPHLILAHSREEHYGVDIACTIALAYLELAAPSFGLGACWAGFVHEAIIDWEPLIQSLGLPKENTCYGAMMIGYPLYVYHRMPLRNEATISWKG